jgi:uncharacterized DUF497 family protein
MRDDEFELDDNKAAANLARHGVSFADARRAFDDVLAIEIEDRRGHYGEDRYVLVGVAQHRLLAVTYTFRGERSRIITARPAEPFERRLYHEKNREG